jgi:hypothetical protein
MLAGSPCKSYTIPGPALFIIVGGAALLVTIMMIRPHPLAALASAAAGSIIIILFEIVEVMVIGSPEGISRDLQIFYFTLGGLIILLAAAFWLVNRSESQ